MNNCSNCKYGCEDVQVCSSPKVCNEYSCWEPRKNHMNEADLEELERYRAGLRILYKRSKELAFQYGDLGGACYGALRLVISGGGRDKEAIDRWYEEHDE